MRPLPYPPEAEQDPESLEMLRGWIVKGELQLSLAAWVWQDEPQTWGRLLVEAAAHVADAVAIQTGRDRAKVFAKISDSIAHHLSEPPNDLVGELVEP